MTRKIIVGPGSPVGATLGATSHESRASTLPQEKSRSLWLWVGGAFCLMLLAWVVLFKVAHSANVERVPLATKGGRP